MTQSKHARNLEDIVYDLLWPQSGICVDPEADQRHMAVAEVLCRVPEPDYQRLLDLVDSFLWFIPPYGEGAMVYPFPWTTKQKRRRSYAAVLFLNPSMESWGFDVIVAAIAHELAHLFLGHKLFTLPEQYEAQEKEAWSLVRKWGFEDEEWKHAAFYKRRHAREKAMIAALMKQQT